MENKDTIHLLKECDAGSKMAVTSLDEVMESVQDEKLKELLKIVLTQDWLYDYKNLNKAISINCFIFFDLFMLLIDY